MLLDVFKVIWFPPVVLGLSDDRIFCHREGGRPFPLELAGFGGKWDTRVLIIAN